MKKSDQNLKSNDKNDAKQPKFVEGFTEGWKGTLPTKPWPTKALQAQSDSDDENVELQYNPSRGIYFHDCQKPMKVTKTSDPTKSVVDLYDSTDDEQVLENENSRTVTQPKSTMFSTNKSVSTQPSLGSSKKLAR